MFAPATQALPGGYRIVWDGMRRLALYRGNVYVFGARFPTVVMAIFVVTLLATLVGAVGLRNGLPLLDYVGLAPVAVLHGQLWRLLTWFLFALGLGPLSLLIWAMMLLMFGRDLCDAWGWRRFTGVYLGIGAVTGLGTCLIAVVWRALREANYMDSWPVVNALVIAWALMFPTRQILFNFMIPVSGKALLWITVGVTVFFALLYGIAPFVPHLVALAVIFAYMRGTPLVRRRFLELRLRALQGPPRRRPPHLRPVDDPDEKPRWYH
jgi:membrane associated rhomboid family serine protease